MAIKLSEAEKLDRLRDEEGKNFRDISKETGYSLGFLSNYYRHKIPVINESSTGNEGSVCSNSVHNCSQGNVQGNHEQDEQVNIVKELEYLKKEMKEYLDKILENYNVEVSKDDLHFFKKDILVQVREEVKEQVNTLNNDLIGLKVSLEALKKELEGFKSRPKSTSLF